MTTLIALLKGLPSAAVRHCSMAVMTRRCTVGIDVTLLSIGVSVAAEHVRHFQLWSIHGPDAQKVLRWRDWSLSE